MKRWQRLSRDVSEITEMSAAQRVGADSAGISRQVRSGD